MKKAHLALSLLSLSFLAACGGAAAASAAGVYEVDKVALKATILAGMTDAQKVPQALEAIDAMVKDMVMTFDLKADGTAAMNMEMSMMGQKMKDSTTGTWKLEGTKLTMTAKNKEGKDEPKTVDFVNGTFTVEQETGGQKVKVTFKRK